MHNLKIPQISNVSTYKSHNQNAVTEAKLVISTDKDTKIQIEDIPHGVMVLIAVFCFMAVWAAVVIIISVFADIRQVARDEDGRVTVHRFKKLPCRRCRFFHENSALKCAVHPSITLTEQALDCPDYWSW